MSEAIILAGGFGTRLRDVVSNVPKPMAPVRGVPFLCYLLRSLSLQHYDHVVLATGYMHHTIESYFGHQHEGIALDYSVEHSPLGTGGAIVAALQQCHEESITVLNGDTLFAADLARLQHFANACGAPLCVVLRQVDDVARYGSVSLNASGRITGFREKDQAAGAGLINGGIYQLRRSLLSDRAVGEAFSFEKEVLQRHYDDLPFYAYADEAFFIDIGVPSDYEHAQTLLPEL